MKLLTSYRKFKQRLQNILPNHDFIVNLALSVALVAVICGIIWTYGPALSYGGHTPLASPEKRIYAIAFCMLAWLLKFIILDLAFPNTLRYRTPETRDRLDKLLKLFNGASRFIQKTDISHNGNSLKLQELPWYLLIGPESSGKTALLAHADIPFVLKRQFPSGLPDNFEPSENPDWWITRDATIVDVPSKFLFHAKDAESKGENPYRALWRLFLNLIKRQKKKQIKGVIIALPLAQIIKHYSNKQFDSMIQTLAKRIEEIQQIAKKPLEYQIIITKCDMLPGFKEFFAEAPDDEITQAWGVSIQANDESPDQQFSKRFNALVKKLNQQLIWRLHQERNPMARPAIKDFPIQIERLKEFTAELIKLIASSQANCELKGVYLTSAKQAAHHQPQAKSTETASETERAIQLFKMPPSRSRAYFIKQVLLNAFQQKHKVIVKPLKTNTWKRVSAYAASAAIIVSTGYMLGRDFQAGVKQTYEIRSNLAGYRQVLQEFHNPDQNMMKTLALLDALKRTFKPVNDKTVANVLMSFYSNKSQRNATRVYQHALQTFLMPEVKNYFADYLKDPVNKKADSIYGVLKAYLMLGDSQHLDKDYVRNVLLAILPKTFSQKEVLAEHLDAALNNNFKPMQLNNKIIKHARNYLNGMPGAKLGFIILQSMNDNTKQHDVTFDIGDEADVIFSNASTSHNIPLMYTGKEFKKVIKHQVPLAANEAVNGNWILSDSIATNDPLVTNKVADELRETYVSEYTKTWEQLINSIKMIAPKDLAQADAMIVSLTSYDSPLLQVLHVVYENTNFELVMQSSKKLSTIDKMINDTTSSNQLYQILTELQSLHEYLQPVIGAEDETKAAYKLLAERMEYDGDDLDPITKLRLVANTSPRPIKTWINELTNSTWHFLLNSSMRYLNTSWQQRVAEPYQKEIADRYPFSKDAPSEVGIRKFIHFFGKPGVVTSFYTKYLSAFIDTTNKEWKWKTMNDEPLPFSKTVLRQIQQAMKIHHAFFPNDDDQLYVPFSLQKTKLSDKIKSVKLNINDKVIEDSNSKDETPHVLKWPHRLDAKSTSIQLTMDNDKTINNVYQGSWGWFKAVDQAYESTKSNNEIIVNFSKNKLDARYVLSTKSKDNPFIALGLQHFKLENNLTTTA